MYLYDAWYVAALDSELVPLRPLAVQVLDQRIVLYRQSDGTPVALEDACVHRKVPLSLGRIQGDTLECGYHGLRFNAAGVCVHIPCSDHIPHNARVRSYPVAARYGFVWIWMGSAERAREDLIFPVEHWGEPGWAATPAGHMRVACHYLYITDNLLDPSHVAWVHPSSFGNAACANEAVSVQASDSGVIASRWMKDVEVAPLYIPFMRFRGNCDRLQHYEVRYPCHALIKALFVPAHSGGPEAATRSDAFIMDSYNFLTPVDAATTHYYWLQMRNVDSGDPAPSQLLADGVRQAFEEDRLILNAVQQGFERSKTANIDIAIDSAPLRFRRRLKGLISKAHES